VLLLLVAGLEVAGPLILGEAIDGRSRRGRPLGLLALAAAYAGILAAVFAVRYVQAILMNYIGQG